MSELEGIKTLCQISIQDATLRGVAFGSSSSGAGAGKSSVSVCFQRGIKSVSSREREVLLEHGRDVSVSFGQETLTLVVTMVRDSKTGMFREKVGKLVLMRRKAGKLFGTGFQGLAVGLLPLHELLADFSMRKVALQLVDCNGIAGGTINVTINPKFISEVRVCVVVQQLSLLVLTFPPPLSSLNPLVFCGRFD